MEIKIARGDLLNELQRVQGIVERKTTMPILANVLLEAKNKALTVTATDLEVGLTSTSTASVERPGKVTVHARALYDIVRELPEEVIHLAVGDNHWITMRCGRSEFKIVGLPAEEFPALPKKGEGVGHACEAQAIFAMIEKTAFAMSADETRYNLNGVLIDRDGEGEKAQLRMVATDGHRLSIVERPAAGFPVLTRGAILPRKGVLELKRLLEGSAETFDLWIDQKHAIAYVGKVTLTIRLIDGQFPPYQQVVPKQGKRLLSIDRQAILKALRRISVLAGERTRGVRFALSPKHLELSSSTPDVGEAREELSATYRGDAFAVGFNARYFLDALAVLEDDQAVLQLGDDTAPCLIKSEFDRGFTHVIMPMRL